MASRRLSGDNQLRSAAQVQRTAARSGRQGFHRRRAGGAVIPAAQRDVSSGQVQRGKAVGRAVQHDFPFRGTQHGIVPREIALHRQRFRSFLDEVHVVPADGASVAVASGVNILDQVHHGVV